MNEYCQYETMLAEELKKQAEDLMGRDEFDAAAELLERNRSLVDTDLSLSWDLGWCYYRMERYLDAEPHLERAAEMGPAGKGTLAYLYLKLGRDVEAEGLLREVTKGRKTAVGRLGLALALMKQGKLDDAELIHLENIEIDPNDVERVEAYADFLSDVGREEEAKVMYDRAEALAGKAE